MKKLKNKVFWVIFSLLTIFTLIIIIVSLTETYMERKKSISDILMKISNTVEKVGKNSNLSSDENKQDYSKKIYLDFTVYTIVLDESGEYSEIINNTSNEILNEKNIKKIAETIIANHDSNFYIGNLYKDKYAYIFTPNNTFVIMDNTELNDILVKGLFFHILVFIICEIVIFIATYFITKWIISPIKKTLEKQKIFVADASHELKTPLSVMIASADAYFNDKDEKWVKNMKNESERMIKLVTELLDLAKTEEEQDIVMQQNDLSSIVESSILTFESLFYDNNIELKYDIEKDIKLLCNETLLTELMSILIDNAIKHCKEKGKVIVILYRKSKQIFLEVKNTGLPIKKEEEKKIFERFYKADSSRNRNSNNYGLGLAIAKNIVLKHKGNVSAYSNKGYTTFKVTWNQK